MVEMKENAWSEGKNRCEKYMERKPNVWWFGRNMGWKKKSSENHSAKR